VRVIEMPHRDGNTCALHLLIYAVRHASASRPQDGMRGVHGCDSNRQEQHDTSGKEADEEVERFAGTGGNFVSFGNFMDFNCRQPAIKCL
jgi:hypothetical protein